MRWDFPADASAVVTSDSNSRSIYRFRVPPGLPGNRQGSVFDGARIDVVEAADMTRELDRMRQAYGMKHRGENIGSFEVFEADPTVPPSPDREVALVPTGDASYFLRCTATTTNQARRLLGACGVTLQLRPLAEVQYYIHSDDVFRAGEINERMRSIMDDWIVTPSENTSHGNSR